MHSGRERSFDPALSDPTPTRKGRRPGKVERFRQTQKKWLTAHPATTIAELQPLLDQFRGYYNQHRPHRALARRTPIQAYTGRPKATPTGYLIPAHYRVRTDVIDAAGVITIRYNSRLHHIGLSKRRRGTKVTVLIDDRDKHYRPSGVKCGNSAENRL